MELRSGNRPLSEWIWGGAAVLTICLLMSDPNAAMEQMRRGMLICVRTMIPSLFPFMVVSEIIVRSGAGELLLGGVAKRLSPRLGLPREGPVAVLLGWLCGFPVGARTAAAYAAKGRLTQREFHVLLALGNVPSAAFLMSAVGVSLFGSAAVGRAMLLLCLGAAVVSGAVLGRMLPRRGGWCRAVEPLCKPAAASQEAASPLLPAAIGAAATSMLGICATVLLFSALIGTLGGLFDALTIGKTVQAAFLGALELASGVCAAAGLSSPEVAAVLCAAMAGWGGLSIHCQILAVCRGVPVKMGWFWLSRLLQAALCGGGMALLIALGGLTVPTMPEPMAWLDLMAGQPVAQRSVLSLLWCGIWGVIFLGALILGAWKREGRGKRR